MLTSLGTSSGGMGKDMSTMLASLDVSAMQSPRNCNRFSTLAVRRFAAATSSSSAASPGSPGVTAAATGGSGGASCATVAEAPSAPSVVAGLALGSACTLLLCGFGGTGGFGFTALAVAEQEEVLGVGRHPLSYNERMNKTNETNKQRTRLQPFRSAPDAWRVHWLLCPARG